MFNWALIIGNFSKLYTAHSLMIPKIYLISVLPVGKHQCRLNFMILRTKIETYAFKGCMCEATSIVGLFKWLVIVHYVCQAR